MGNWSFGLEQAADSWEYSNMKTKYIYALVAILAMLIGCSSVPQVPSQALTISDDIIKSPNDERDYRYLELANGLKVVLISDPAADKSAASLSVYRGSFDDPIERPGLAHFLEHMLFIGTEKYPEPDGYFSYIRGNGGSSNAYTASEVTNYFFDIKPEAFEEGLDRFAQFFIAPLLQKEYAEREKNAVHSEYQLQIKEDGWRAHVVAKQTMNPAHSLSRFNIGSLETLSGDVHGALINFFENNYSANQMGLVVLDKKSIDAIQPRIIDLFGKIKNRQLNDVQRQDPLFLDGQLPVTLRHDNLKEQWELTYTFPIPPITDHYRKKPAGYLANLIGHEGEGSLHKSLSELGWINMLGAGPSIIDDSHATMSIRMQLTEEGADHIPEITGFLFAYLNLLRDGKLEEWIYEEQALVADLGFRFAEKTSAIATVQALSPALEHYPAKDLLVAPYLMEEFDASLIKRFLRSLVPSNVMIAISAPGYAGQRTEQWFNVQYDLEVGPIDTLEIDASTLSLPARNPFLPKSLTLVSGDDDIPLPVIDDADAQIYVDTDLEFNVPRAVTYVSLRNQSGLMTAENVARSRLYSSLAQDDLNSLAYPALLAGVSYEIGAPPKGFRIAIGGYQDKQFVLLEEVINRLVNLDIREERFSVLKEKLLADLRNTMKDRPFRQVLGRLMEELVGSAWPASDLITELESVSVDDLTRWRDEIFQEVSVKALIHGNVEDARANSLKELISSYIPLAEDVSSSPTVRKITGKTEVELDIDHNDAAMILYVQDENTSLGARARSALLTHLIAPAYFSSLRTEQQLGYVVSAMNPVFYEQGGISFLIQSPVAGPHRLKKRTQLFLEEQEDQIDQMTEEEFMRNRAGLAARLMQRDKNLHQRAQRYWSELDRGITTFDAKRQMADTVLELKKQDILGYLRQAISLLDTEYLFIYSSGKFNEGE